MKAFFIYWNCRIIKKVFYKQEGFSYYLYKGILKKVKGGKRCRLMKSYRNTWKDNKTIIKSGEIEMVKEERKG